MVTHTSRGYIVQCKKKKMGKTRGNYVEVDCSIQEHANMCKCFFQESGDGKNLPESRDSDTKKGQHVPVRKGSQTTAIPRRSPEDKNEKISKESLSTMERSTKSGTKAWECPPCCRSHQCTVKDDTFLHSISFSNHVP